jgi:transposase-like protein
MMSRRAARPAAPQYQDFQATALYCPRCRAAMPVRSRLLLVLPDGELHEYLCQVCASSLGTKTVKNAQEMQLFIP